MKEQTSKRILRGCKAGLVTTLIAISTTSIVSGIGYKANAISRDSQLREIGWEARNENRLITYYDFENCWKRETKEDNSKSYTHILFGTMGFCAAYMLSKLRED